ncbi:MAG: hypothetical protein JWP48_1604 [Actinoallomurus sp.]|nr:hypothetical protein [Actinoallomurus sp.]
MEPVRTLRLDRVLPVAVLPVAALGVLGALAARAAGDIPHVVQYPSSMVPPQPGCAQRPSGVRTLAAGAGAGVGAATGAGTEAGAMPQVVQ